MIDKTLTIHHTPDPHPDTSTPDPHQDSFSKTVLGFWMYLMTDCLIFATLFITYAVLHTKTFGGPSAKDLFSLGTAFAETMILLTSSITCGFSVLGTLQRNKAAILAWLAVTFILGASFLAIELHEFYEMVEEGHSWQRSAFLTSFFTLVGTHGLHITIGLFWMLVMMGQIAVSGVTVPTFRRLVVFNMYWHFLDLVWIFIFTFVYLLGVM